MHTQKDAELVDWIARLGAAEAEHVMERFAMGRSWAYARLSALVLGGLLEHRTLLYRRPGLYIATSQGLRWCGLQELGIFRVDPGGFTHAREVAEVAVALDGCLPGWRILSEREVRMQERGGPLLASAKLAELPTGQAALHRPDLAAVSPAGSTLAIEVELSVKAPRRLVAICRAWARARHVAAVYYLAPPAPAKALARAIAATRAAHRITVLGLSEPHAIAGLELGRVANALH